MGAQLAEEQVWTFLVGNLMENNNKKNLEQIPGDKRLKLKDIGQN